MIKPKRQAQNPKAGFTIIEVMIVLVAAAIILLIVFIAVPDFKKEARNRQRDADATQLVAAIDECMVNHGNSASACDTPGAIDLPTDELSIYSGYHYGSTDGLADTTPDPPTINEMNWLFGLQCTQMGNYFSKTDNLQQFVVTYVKEGSGSSVFYRCIDGV